jgi:signal transduction histidine kinase
MQPQQSSSATPAPEARTSFGASLRSGIWHVPQWLLALTLGFIVLASGAALDVLVQHQHATLWSAIQPSDWFAAMVAVAFFYRILLYERERRQAIRRRLEVIAETNHHIRNSLYVISLSTHSSQDQEMVKLIEDSLQRIDWTLKQILPRL